jgi:hypothetical protein
MKCKNCTNDIDNKMKAAIAKNLCPFCDGEIMEPKRLEQLKNLEKVLSSKRFTNNDDVNKKICEKVVETLLEHFEFNLLQPIKETEDIIVLDAPIAAPVVAPVVANVVSTATSVEAEIPTDKPTRALQQIRQEAKLAAITETGSKSASPDISFYTNACNEQSDAVDFSNMPTSEELDGLTPEETAALMQVNPEISQKIERLKNLAPKKMGNIEQRSAGKNKSISRC